jgi:hypothetical protein
MLVCRRGPCTFHSIDPVKPTLRMTADEGIIGSSLRIRVKVRLGSKAGTPSRYEYAALARMAADVDERGVLHHLGEKTRRLDPLIDRGAGLAALRRCSRG